MFHSILPLLVLLQIAHAHTSTFGRTSSHIITLFRHNFLVFLYPNLLPYVDQTVSHKHLNGDQVVILRTGFCHRHLFSPASHKVDIKVGRFRTDVGRRGRRVLLESIFWTLGACTFPGYDFASETPATVEGNVFGIYGCEYSKLYKTNLLQ